MRYSICITKSTFMYVTFATISTHFYLYLKCFLMMRKIFCDPLSMIFFRYLVAEEKKYSKLILKYLIFNSKNSYSLSFILDMILPEVIIFRRMIGQLPRDKLLLHPEAIKVHAFLHFPHLHLELVHQLACQLTIPRK